MSARVLVVDDIPVNVKLLEAKLLVEYYEVITANDGPSALKLVEEQSPDIILLDVMMPGMDGYEVCRQIKANPATSHVPVVMVTALNEVRDRVVGLEAGADDFLTKPVNDVALFARIRSLVRLKRAGDEWRAREETSVHLGITDDGGQRFDETDPGRILLVDEGSWDSTNVAATLREQQHELVIAGSHDEAKILAKEGDFHLVLINDSVMGEDALRLCSHLRSEEETRHGPILLMMEDGNEERLAKALELGVNDYLIRPIDNDELVARTRTQVNRKRYEERLRSNYQESMNAAVTDSLTGLYNRRYLEAHFDKVCMPLIGGAKSVSALMLDIDNFKQVNDTHGHDVGDEVLREIGTRIQNNLRGSDTAARYGGEEFVVLTPEAPLSVAVSVAERLCHSVADMPVKVSCLADGLPVTVSIGIATGVAGEIKLDPLLKCADEALYRAKNEGKNRVVAAEHPDHAAGAVEAEKSRPDTATRAVG